MTSNRDALRICVVGVGAAASAAAEARDRIQQQLPSVAQRPEWAAARLTGTRTIVDTNCPADPLLLRPGVEYVDGRPGANGGEQLATVQQPSVYRLYVFLVPSPQLTSIIQGKFDVRSAPQEFLCRERTCAEVTTGVYLTPDEMRNNATLTTWLARGIGLERATPLETPPDAPRQTP
ncbi:MAG: hypothetical protein ACRDJE_23995 [Dehalococcoidia bacterium]